MPQSSAPEADRVGVHMNMMMNMTVSKEACTKITWPAPLAVWPQHHNIAAPQHRQSIQVVR